MLSLAHKQLWQSIGLNVPDQLAWLLSCLCYQHPNRSAVLTVSCLFNVFCDQHPSTFRQYFRFVRYPIQQNLFFDFPFLLWMVLRHVCDLLWSAFPTPFDFLSTDTSKSAAASFILAYKSTSSQCFMLCFWSSFAALVGISSKPRCAIGAGWPTSQSFSQRKLILFCSHAQTWFDTKRAALDLNSMNIFISLFKRSFYNQITS